MVTPNLRGVTPLHQCDCDETEPHQPGPLTLLSTERSPSRSCYQTPLVGSYPTVSPITLQKLKGWIALCCGCSQRRFAALCPHLLFREAVLLQYLGVESREVPLPQQKMGQRRLQLFSKDQILKNNAQNIQASPAGFEPATFWSATKCSIH